jgi:hypothetical protein
MGFRVRTATPREGNASRAKAAGFSAVVSLSCWVVGARRFVCSMVVEWRRVVVPAGPCPVWRVVGVGQGACVVVGVWACLVVARAGRGVAASGRG